MPRVFIPTSLLLLADGNESIDLPGRTISQILDQLTERYPELGRQLRDGDLLSPSVSLAIDGDLASRSLATEVEPESEVHFIPAIAGG
jgi:molybdopterin synthase sulfur carrier subunit